jgi:hypothetical protein
MEIRFISSLTPEDESQLASAICDAVGRLLGPFSLAYTIRIVTTDGQTFYQHSPSAMAPPVAAATDLAAS